MRNHLSRILCIFVLSATQSPPSEHVVINEDYVLIGIVTHWHRYSLGTKNSYLRGTPVKVISEAKSSIKN